MEHSTIEETAHHTTTESMEAIPVKVVKDEQPETIKAATFGSWASYIFTGTATDTPVQILPQDSRRKRAVIQGLPGFANNNTLGNMWIGSRAQVTNGNPQAAGAGIFVSGMSMTIEAEQSVWVMSDGAHALCLTVHDEIYRS